MILLDTNICIHIINAKPPAVLQRFRDYRMGEIGVCSVVAAELAYGVAKGGSARNRQALDRKSTRLNSSHSSVSRMPSSA